MIDRGTTDALARIAQRSHDLLQSYRPGFEPSTTDVAATARPVPNLDPLSVAAPEGTYFLTQDRDGKPRYSRDGGFRFVSGDLVDVDGSPVLGFADGAARGKLAPIRLEAVDRALGRASDERIETDGSVTYARAAIDPRTGARRSERVTIARVALARLPAGSLPIRVDATHVEPPRGVVPELGVPGDGRFGALATYARDVGRLDLVTGLQRLQEAYQSFEAMRSAFEARSAVVKTTMDLVK